MDEALARSSLRDGAGSAHLPLRGVSVLVPRPAESQAAVGARLRDLGAEVIECPTIAFEGPTDPGPLEEALDTLSRYAWVVFTSARGARAVFDLARTKGKGPEGFARCRIAAVGPATAESLRGFGLRVDLVPEEETTEALGEALAREGIEGKRILLPRADIANRALAGRLRAAGAHPDEVVAYRTVPAPPPSPEVRRRVEEGDLHVLAFTSASTVKHFLRLFGGGIVRALEPRARVVTIGPVTSAAAREAGFRVDREARPHTVGGLVAAIVAVSENQGR